MGGFVALALVCAVGVQAIDCTVKTALDFASTATPSETGCLKAAAAAAAETLHPPAGSTIVLRCQRQKGGAR